MITKFGEATDIYKSLHYGSSKFTYIGWHIVSDSEQYAIWRYQDGTMYYCFSSIVKR